jgi:hypothetical protein
MSEDYAQTAYAGYAAVMDGTGYFQPAWEDLPIGVQNAWFAASVALRAQLAAEREVTEGILSAMPTVPDANPSPETNPRRIPKTGEVWEFSNGVTATIYDVTDRNYGVPECAYMGGEPGETQTMFFKYNDSRDPMPIRKI